MSCWTRPTTADIGIRAFASTETELFVESTMGMLEIVSHGQIELANTIAHDGVWNVEVKSNDLGLLLVKWLDEVLYQLEVNNRWLTQMIGRIEISADYGKYSAQVSWVDSDLLAKEIEIKAVTTHELEFKELSEEEVVSSEWQEIPSFHGPGWYCDVVFDI